MFLHKSSLPRWVLHEPRQLDGELVGTRWTGRTGLEHVLVHLTQQDSSQLPARENQHSLSSSRGNVERRRRESRFLAEFHTDVFRIRAIRKVELPSVGPATKVERNDFNSAHVVASFVEVSGRECRMEGNS